MIRQDFQDVTTPVQSMVPPVQSNFFEWPNCLCHILARGSAGLRVLHFLPQLAGRRDLGVLLPSRVSHVCFASLGVVAGLAGRGGELPWAGLRCSEEAPAQRAQGPGAGTGCCPHPLSWEVQWLKIIPSFKAKAHIFLQSSQLAFFSVLLVVKEN